MGYNTRFDVSITDTVITKEIKGVDAFGKPASVYVNEYIEHGIIKDAIEEVSGYSYSSLEDGCKWYDHERDMIAVSKKFSGVLLALYGKGDDDEDLWIKYFKNGKYLQKCQGRIVYDEFDPKLAQ